MSGINKQLLRTVVPPHWVEVEPSDSGYCYLHCIQGKYRQKMAYYLGIQPDWVDVLNCGYLAKSALVSKRKNKDGTYHVYPCSCGVPPFQLWFPPGAMVGNGPPMTEGDCYETAFLMFIFGPTIGAAYAGWALLKFPSKRAFSSYNIMIYTMLLLLLTKSILTEATNDTRSSQEPIDETAGHSNKADDGKPKRDNTAHENPDPKKHVSLDEDLEDEEDYVIPIVFNGIDHTYLTNLDFDLPDHYLCLVSDDVRHELLSVKASTKTIAGYIISKCPQLWDKDHRLWLKQARLLDAKLQALKADDYMVLAAQAAESINNGVKAVLKSTGSGLSEAASMTSGLVTATGAIASDATHNVVNVLKDNRNVISDEALRVKAWGERVVDSSPDVSDIIDAGITTVSEVHKFVNLVTEDIRSGEDAATMTKHGVSAVISTTTSIASTLYESTENVVKQGYSDSWSAKEISKWSRKTFSQVVRHSKSSPKEVFEWIGKQDFGKGLKDAIETAPWLARTYGRTIVAPMTGMAIEMDRLDDTWFSARGLGEFRKAIIGDWSEFKFIYKQKEKGFWQSVFGF